MGAVRQLSLFDEPVSHFELVHNKLKTEITNVQASGKIIAWTPKNEKKKWHSFSPDNAYDLLPNWLNQSDVFITPNQFYGWRKIANLHSLQAFFIDIDCHHINFENPSEDDLLLIPAIVTDRLDRLQREHVPEPNCIVYTGRGVHFYWIIEPTDARALPRWQACQKRLVTICDGDRQSADATRVLRLVGSINSKNNTQVRAEKLHGQIYKFDWLHDQIMPLARQELAEIRDIRAIRATRGLKPVRAAGQGSIYQRWYLVYQDLLLIIEYHVEQNKKGHGLAEGIRNLFLYHLANALSWFTISDALDNEIVDCARRFTPTLTVNEAKSYCSSVLERARKTQLDGQEHRYRYKRETLYNELIEHIPAHIEPQLRAIISDDTAKERKLSRQTIARRAAGVVKRSEYERSKTQVADQNALKAQELKEQGMSIRAIAKELGVSVGTASNYLKRCSTV